jgi:hypothetical protein
VEDGLSMIEGAVTAEVTEVDTVEVVDDCVIELVVV